MNDYRKYCLTLTLISAALGGCGGGGDDGSAVVVDPEPLPPPAATPAVNAGDDQNVIEMILSASKLLPQDLAVTHPSPTTGAESTAPT